MNTSNRLRRLFVDDIGIEAPSRSEFLSRLGLDSLDQMNLANVIEIEFGVRISDRDMIRMISTGTVQQLENLIDQHLDIGIE